MSAQPEQTILETSFQIESIEPVADPTGGSEPWFRYVISQGPNSDDAITGIRTGNLADVNADVLAMVERLNERCGKLAKKKK